MLCSAGVIYTVLKLGRRPRNIPSHVPGEAAVGPMTAKQAKSEPMLNELGPLFALSSH